MPSAKLQNVDAKQDYRYQVLLVREKKKKAEVFNVLCLLTINIISVNHGCFKSVDLRIIKEKCLIFKGCLHSSHFTWPWAHCGGVEVAGCTVDRKTRFRFLAYPHRVWALWWQGGKIRLWTSWCPCRGRLGTLKTHSVGCPAAGQNLEKLDNCPVTI